MLTVFRMNLRDVIFGEAAFNYEEGKFEKVPIFGVVFRPNYNRVSVNAGNMRAFVESAGRPNYHFGEYISGSAVRGDASTIFTKIKETVRQRKEAKVCKITNGQHQVNRNVIALDMEASAFLQLCNHFGHSGLTSLGVIKGVSDFGNARKGHDQNAYPDALANAAKALEVWVTYQVPAITWTADESRFPCPSVSS